MIVEERTYRILSGRMAEYLRLYEEQGLAIQRAVLGNLIGYFTIEVGQQSSLVHLWGYESMDDRARRRAELSLQPGWQAYLKVCTPLIQEMENRILVPTSFSPLR
jgi:hypothetical protein